ncbi:Aste57867_9287 [Aphanomyces stellatus]|uniref:Aste57867_9287 protein n=1 Tax=Aphanomyces stellatus TaxID=120398 RepID=A0A485KMT7_9STRA|nr:hypothetical protein As57867_009251 [Aphanomyces stellatus]VFT86169.1 Aste57867_9287 [Aphanomyces stellatus]
MSVSSTLGDDDCSLLVPRRPSLVRSPLRRLVAVGVVALYVCVGLFVIDSVALLNAVSWGRAAHFVATTDTNATTAVASDDDNQVDEFDDDDALDDVLAPPASDTVAIVAYVPGTKPEYIGQANHLLFASWNYSCHHVNRTTRNRTDLVFFAHASILDELPPTCRRLKLATYAVDKHQRIVKDQCYVIEHSPPTDDFWHRNKFMHSLTYLAIPAHRPLLASYARLLRTDLDCAITPAFLTYRPDKFVVGKGGYMYDETKPQLLQLVRDLNLTHQGLFNIGSTWFGNATLILDLIPHMLDVAKFILTSPVYGVEKGWPLWHVPVTSMYAGEITVNHFVPAANLLINDETFDVNAVDGTAIATLYHIHCWPSVYQGYFDKWAFKRGEYTTEKYPRASLDTSIVRDYIMTMALYESPVVVDPTPSSIDNVAVVAYVADTKAVLHATKMLWASWDNARRKVTTKRPRADLIFFIAPSVVGRMPPSCVRLDPAHPAFMVSDVLHHIDDQCVVIVYPPPIVDGVAPDASRDTFWDGHAFMHNTTYLAEPMYRSLLTSYKRLLRTDVDCAITPAFLTTAAATHLVVGTGQTMVEPTHSELLHVASLVNLTHRGRVNLGSTWFGNATLIVDLVPHILDIAKVLMTSHDSYPLAAISTYASELALNHYLPNEAITIHDSRLDVPCMTDQPIDGVFHLHCWPDDAQSVLFDSLASRKDAYTTALLDPTVVRDYMLVLALHAD